MTPYLKATDYLLLDNPLFWNIQYSLTPFYFKDLYLMTPIFFISKACTSDPPFCFKVIFKKKKTTLKIMFNWRDSWFIYRPIIYVFLWC